MPVSRRNLSAPAPGVLPRPDWHGSTAPVATTAIAEATALSGETGGANAGPIASAARSTKVRPLPLRRALAAVQLPLGAAVCLALSSGALAQTASPSTDDAFGFRAGIEQFGLYSEGQARGFDLTRSNAYRIDDAYFVRAAALSDTIIENVAVRVGVSAARSATPSPTGVVGYRLKASDASRQRLTIGYRNYASPFVEADVRGQALGGKVSVAGGVVLQPDVTYPDGVNGRSADVGGVARAQMGEHLHLTAFGSKSEVEFDGNYAFAPRGAALPSVLDGQTNLGAPYARSRATMTSAGVLADWRAGHATRLHVSAMRSERLQHEADFTLLAIGDALDDGAQATLFRTPSATSESSAFEARAEHEVRAGGVLHGFSVAGRMRRSDNRYVGGTAFNLGRVALPAPDYGPASEYVAPAGRIIDSTEQDTVAAGYRAQLGERLELRAGGALTRQQRRIRPVEGAATRDAGSYGLPYASVVWVRSPALTLLGSYVEGLEDTGAAPPTAANRNEILAAVLASQSELGFTRRWGASTIGGSVFEITKPVPGIDAANVYRFVGNVRHRGAELTLATSIGSATRALAGFTALDARQDAGRTPAGISDRLGFMRFEHRLSQATSLTALINHRNGQFVGGRPELRTDAITTMDLGFRHAFDLAGRRATLNGTAANIFDEREWVATAGGVLVRNGPRTFRLALSVDL